MTIASLSARNDYVGDGATSVYPYTWVAFSTSDILAVMTDTLGVETTLVLGVDYTVDVAGVQYTNGGNVTLLTSSNLPSGVLPTGYGLALVRDTPLTQPTSIRNQRDFYPEVHETAFDRLVAQVQQIAGGLRRALQIPVSEAGPMPIPSSTSRALQFLGFDASGNPTVGQPVSSPATPFWQNVLALPTVIFSFANNVVVATSVTGLLFDGGVGSLGGVTIRGNIRLTTGVLELIANVEIHLVYKQLTSTWSLAAVNYFGDDLSGQLAFTVTAAGQVKYTSSNNGYSGTGTFTVTGEFNA